MSSFRVTARHRETGEIHEVWCFDYFGRHQYCFIPHHDGNIKMTEEQFDALYDMDIVMESKRP